MDKLRINCWGSLTHTRALRQRYYPGSLLTHTAEHTPLWKWFVPAQRFICLHTQCKLLNLRERCRLDWGHLSGEKKIICPVAAFKEGVRGGLDVLAYPAKGLSFHAFPEQNKWPNQIGSERGEIKLFEWKRWNIRCTTKDKDKGQCVQILQIRSVSLQLVVRISENADKQKLSQGCPSFFIKGQCGSRYAFQTRLKKNAYTLALISK